jgi:hypothetical protein
LQQFEAGNDEIQRTQLTTEAEDIVLITSQVRNKKIGIKRRFGRVNQGMGRCVILT